MACQKSEDSQTFITEDCNALLQDDDSDGPESIEIVKKNESICNSEFSQSEASSFGSIDLEDQSEIEKLFSVENFKFDTDTAVTKKTQPNHNLSTSKKKTYQVGKSTKHPPRVQELFSSEETLGTSVFSMGSDSQRSIVSGSQASKFDSSASAPCSFFSSSHHQGSSVNSSDPRNKQIILRPDSGRFRFWERKNPSTDTFVQKLVKRGLMDSLFFLKTGGTPSLTTQFLIEKHVGKGAFGHVFAVRNRLDKSRSAVKMIRVTPETCDLVWAEVKNWAKLSHTHVCRYFHSWLEPLSSEQIKYCFSPFQDSDSDSSEDSFSRNSDIRKSIFSPQKALIAVASEKKKKSSSANVELALFIKMELCVENLQNWMLQRTRLIPSKSIALLSQILSAVFYIHEKKIFHRDIKPANIFLDSNDIAKLGDFGLSIAKKKAHSSTHEGSNTRKKTKVGTFLYSPAWPCSGEQHDFFSVGIIAIELFVLFSTGAERARVLKQAHEGILPESLTRDFPVVSKLVRLLIEPKVRTTSIHNEVLKLVRRVAETETFVSFGANCTKSPVSLPSDPQTRVSETIETPRVVDSENCVKSKEEREKQELECHHTDIKVEFSENDINQKANDSIPKIYKDDSESSRSKNGTLRNADYFFLSDSANSSTSEISALSYDLIVKEKIFSLESQVDILLKENNRKDKIILDQKKLLNEKNNKIHQLEEQLLRLTQQLEGQNLTKN